MMIPQIKAKPVNDDLIVDYPPRLIKRRSSFSDLQQLNHISQMNKARSNFVIL